MSNATLQSMKIEKRYTAEMFSNVFVRAFLEASDGVQEVIKGMSQIVSDENIDQDDRDAAMETLIEALFPTNHNGELGAYIEDMCEVESEEFGEARDHLENQQLGFAERLEALMESRGLTQTQLAKKINVGQPAISMMLKRACRPQKNTLLKLSKALGVEQSDLWPE